MSAPVVASLLVAPTRRGSILRSTGCQGSERGEWPHGPGGRAQGVRLGTWSCALTDGVLADGRPPGGRRPGAGHLRGPGAALAEVGRGGSGGLCPQDLVQPVRRWVEAAAVA